MSMSCELRVIDVNIVYLVMSVDTGSSLYQLDNPDISEQKEDKGILRILRKRKCKEAIVRLKREMNSPQYVWRKAPCWKEAIVGGLNHTVEDLFGPIAGRLLKDILEDDVAGEIFLGYVENMANAMVVSEYVNASLEQQKKLFEAFKEDFIVPTAKALYENMMLVDKHQRELEDINSADIAAEAYLAARG